MTVTLFHIDNNKSKTQTKYMNFPKPQQFYRFIKS